MSAKQTPQIVLVARGARLHTGVADRHREVAVLVLLVRAVERLDNLAAPIVRRRPRRRSRVTTGPRSHVAPGQAAGGGTEVPQGGTALKLG